MENLNILMWALGGGFLILLGILKIIWNEMKEIRNEMKEFRNELKEIRSSVHGLSLRLARIEGSLSSKDCCMLKSGKEEKRAE